MLAKKGELELSDSTHSLLYSHPQYPLLDPTSPRFFSYLFGSSVTHTQRHTHTHTAGMSVWADGAQCVD